MKEKETVKPTVKVETTKTFNDLNKNPIQLDFEEKWGNYDLRKTFI